MKAVLTYSAIIAFCLFSGCTDSTVAVNEDKELAGIEIPQSGNCQTSGVYTINSNEIEIYRYDGDIHGIKVKIDSKNWLVLTRHGDIGDGNLNEPGMYDVSEYPYNMKFGRFKTSDFDSEGHVDPDGAGAQFPYVAYNGKLEITQVSPYFSGRCYLHELRKDDYRGDKYLKCGFSVENN